MPSWVVPAVAAELWGVSVEHVLAEVAAGRVISRREGEFLFVDVDPNAAEAAQAQTSPTPYRRSLAWTLGTSPHVQQPLVTAAERDALRVSGSKKDDLQAVIAHLKANPPGIPLQFNNFR